MDVDCDDCGSYTDCCNLTTKGKMRALLQKNFLRMWRNVGYEIQTEKTPPQLIASLTE